MMKTTSSVRQFSGVRESAEYAEEEVDPEFTQSEASDVNESAEDAPKAEDTVAGGGE